MPRARTVQPDQVWGAAAGLLTGAPLRAEVCHIFAGVVPSTQPDAGGLSGGL